MRRAPILLLALMPAAALAASQWDGRYVGSYESPGGHCRAGSKYSFTVVDGRLDYRSGDGARTWKGAIEPDGSIELRSNDNLVIKGMFEGDQFTGTILNRCGYEYRLHRVK